MARVLVAEDEPALLQLYGDIVRGLGHECVTTFDGGEALAVARQQKPDVVVCDFMMPGKSGLELARALRADDSLAEVPVIMLSAGRPNERDRREVWRFLQKPVSVDLLEKTIKDALAAAETGGGAFRASSQRACFTHVSPISFAREEMLSWVSHEIKSPLSAAVTATQLATRALDAGEAGGSVKSRLAIIARQLTRMNELVNSLLDAAALQDGKLELARSAVDAVEFVDECVHYWAELHPDVEFQVEHTAGPLDIDGDRERMRQILDNFISNAIKYGRPANRIEIVVQPEGHFVRIAVTDHGRGIPAEHLPRISIGSTASWGKVAVAMVSAFTSLLRWRACTAESWKSNPKSVSARRSPFDCRD